MGDETVGVGADSQPTEPTTAAQLLAEHLDVYDGTGGYWNPDHGQLEIPPGWEFLARGDAFLTRRVKAAGSYWVSWQPRSRHRAHRRLLGLWAPAESIAAATDAAAQTAERRAAARVQGARQRERQEAKYREELRRAIVDYLDFAPQHAALAAQIAAATADHAAHVGSGRVGRTRTLTLDQRGALAARAQIRHQHTTYHDDLERIAFNDWDEQALYRDIKGQANEAVDEFLAKHRSA